MKQNVYKLESNGETRFATETTYEDATLKLLEKTESPVTVNVGRYPYYVPLYVATAR